ncbi:hypothetical protein [Tannockella kyphosi]|uniref:hypothetical protein n=1 Tax=Tannockella kyphosi TaxID=2899121 RepID=UPI0020128006|nr:hypothetical protein [Tannockella kyphosi]
MLFIISLLLSFIFIITLSKVIKKYKKTTYVLTILFSIFVTYVYYSSLYLDSSLIKTILSILCAPFVFGSFTTALFVVVMYLGISNKDARFTKIAMPIRSELSIIACITTFVHNISMVFYIHHYGLNNMEFRFAALISLVLILLLLPLFLTSFHCVKTRLKGKTWKRIQSLAYLFYVLLYVHVLIVSIPSACNGQVRSIINIIIYSIVFLYYFQAKIKMITKKST